MTLFTIFQVSSMKLSYFVPKEVQPILLINFQFEDKKSLIKKFKYGELYWDFFNNTYSNFFDEIEDDLGFIVKKIL